LQHKSRVLVVEDDDAVLELVVTRLEVAGFQTFYARDGMEAMNRVATSSASC